MNKEIIINLLNNKILTLTLSETNQNIFRTYLSALKLNKSLLVLYLQNIGFYNVQSLLNILTHIKSLQQLYFSDCDYNILSIILNYFKINYYINIHLSLSVSLKLTDIESLTNLLKYNNSNNIIELFCIINDDDCIFINNDNDLYNMEILNKNIDFLTNYKFIIILSYIKPLINTLLVNKLLYLHLNFLMLVYNKNLINILQNIIKEKFNLSDNFMKRIEITNELQFYKPFNSVLKK